MLKKFDVDGMTCTACSNGIERNVSKLDGVKSVTVSLMDKSMTVDCDGDKISDEKLIAVVEKLGYSACAHGVKKRENKKEANLLRKRFMFSLIFLVPLLYFSMGAMLGLPSFDKKIDFVLQFVFATSIIVLNFKFFKSGTRALISLSPNMDTLVSLGSASAYIYSVVVTIALILGKLNPSHTFFESSAMVLALVTLGKYLEELSKEKTGNEIEKLNRFIPKTATVRIDGEDRTVLTGELKVGDLVVLKAGDYASIDGVVIEGQASIDKSALTGESMPEDVAVDSKISSGSIIKDGFLIVKAEKVGGDTLFSEIVKIVKNAGASKAPIQKLADKVSGVFVPIVTAIAVCVFLVWIVTTKDWYNAFNFGISVLVISCPCALGLATPVAVMATTGRAAAQGILFKNAQSIQTACKINCVLLDKTATITVGKPKVTDYLNCSTVSDEEIYSIASALECKSSHPLSIAVLDYCGDSEKQVEKYEYVSGKGIIGTVDGVKYYLGNVQLVPCEFNYEKLIDDKDRFLGKTLLYLTCEEKVLAVFAISDCLKEDSKQAIEELKALNVKTIMVTGDNSSTAQHVAKEVCLDGYVAEVLPQEKHAIVEDYKNKGYFVAMVGDGINDSPALKAADLGVAMGNGTDVAIDSSDVVIVGGSLKGVSRIITLGKKSLRIIKQNLFWAFFYNVIAIPIAAGAFSFFGFVLTPTIAAACMSFSSLFVVGNALRITNKNNKEYSEKKEKEELKMKVVIEGMMCKHCQARVKEILSGVKGVKSVEVDLGNKTAMLECKSRVAESTVRSVIENAGYEVISIE